MTDHSRFVGDSSDLKITPGPPAPKEPRIKTSHLGLRELRKHAGLTQEEVAEKIGMRRAHVSRLENSDNARLSTLVDYLDAIGGTVVFEVDGRREIMQRAA